MNIKHNILLQSTTNRLREYINNTVLKYEISRRQSQKKLKSIQIQVYVTLF